jgi:pimeloyl-ACP methyl ester carboxylesterase
MSPRDLTLPGDGVTLAASEWPGHGRAVVALHGVSASRLSLVGVAQSLDGRRPLIAIDLRGHGDSHHPSDGPYTIAQHARDVAAAMRAHGLAGAAVLGHSFGAYVATALAATAPELVATLLLVDGGHPPAPLPGLDMRVLAEMALMQTLARVEKRYATVDDYMASWTSMPALAEAPREWIAAFAHADATSDGGDGLPVHGKASVAAVRAAYADMLDVATIEARFAAIRAPVVVVRAAHGAARGLPPLIADEVVATIRRQVPALVVRTAAEANHYSIILGAAGARLCADTLAELAP